MPDTPKGNTSTISDGNRAVFPKESLEHIKAEKGDSVSFYNLPGPAIVVIKTDSMNVSTFLKSLLAAVAILGVLSMGMIPAFAQEGNATATAPEQPPIQPTIIDQPHIIHLTGKAAQFPFTLYITYPEGQRLIQNITHSVPGTAYDQGSHVEGGLTTWTFFTRATDTYNIEFGQTYENAPNQSVIVRAISNATQVYDETIPIVGDKWKVIIKVETAPEPHFPTPEEVGAVFANRLDLITTGINELKSDHVGQDSRISFLSITLQAETVLGILIIIGAAGMITALGLTIRHLKLKDIQLEEIRTPEQST